MAKIPETEEPLELTDADAADPAPPDPAAIRCVLKAPPPICTTLLDR
jgi:hypothetical protein